MSEEGKEATGEEAATGSFVEKEDVVQEPFFDLNEADPELLELQAKIKAERDKAHHARENTADIEARITKQIAEAVVQKLRDEQAQQPPKEPLEEDEEHKETKETDVAAPFDEPYDNSVEDVWLQHVKDAEMTVKEVEKEPEVESDQIDLKEYQFNRKAIQREGKAAAVRVVPRCQMNNQTRPIRTPLYDLLLEKHNFHKALVREYELRQSLSENERVAKDRYALTVASSRE